MVSKILENSRHTTGGCFPPSLHRHDRPVGGRDDWTRHLLPSPFYLVNGHFSTQNNHVMVLKRLPPTKQRIIPYNKPRKQTGVSKVVESNDYLLLPFTIHFLLSCFTDEMGMKPYPLKHWLEKTKRNTCEIDIGAVICSLSVAHSG